MNALDASTRRARRASPTSTSRCSGRRSKHHKELLAPFGLDATDPSFWDKGVGLIAGMIDELEAMEG